MTESREAVESVADAPDWTPWGRPRLGERGVETAFHHPLVLIRARGEAAVRTAAPADVAADPDLANLEWSPMLWALRGRRHWRSLSGVGAAFAGRDDRLFSTGDAVCEQIFEGGALGGRGLAGWIAALQRRIAFCEARGIVYRHLVIPDGHAICSETILGAPKLAHDRPLSQLLAQGGDKIASRLVYPLQALIDGRAKAETSHPHDVHCTGYGCFLCYRELIAALPGVDTARVAREEDLRLRTVLIAGDVARSVGLPGRRVDFHEPPPVKFKSIVKGTSYKANQVDVYRGEDPSLPRLTMFRTSNSSHLFPFLMRHFSRLVAIATTCFHYDLIESEKPDVVICEMPERYFAPLQLSANEMDRGAPPFDTHDSFEAATGHKLPLPQA